MIRLDTTTRTLEIILTAAQTTNPMACAVCYSDDSPGVSYIGGSKLTSSNGLTAATICLAPAAGVIRDIDFISVYNADTAQKQATIRINDNGTFYSLVDVVMNVDDRLEYTHGSGWKLTDINGQTKQTLIGGSMTSAQLAAIISDETGSGSAVFSNGPTFVNPNANNFRDGLTSTATVAGTTTLIVTSNYQQVFTGTTTQTVVLPDATTLAVGHAFYVHNESTGAVTVNANGGGLVNVLAAGTGAIFVCTSIATAAGTWDFEYFSIISASGKKLTNNNSLTLAGTDGTTMTFPSTSASIARTDAAQAFTGTQTFNDITITTAGLNGNIITNSSTNWLGGTVYKYTTASASYNNFVFITDLISNISSGITDSGTTAGISCQVLRNHHASDAGSLATLQGIGVSYGHFTQGAGTTVTTNAYGISITPRHQLGTITTMYDIYIASDLTGGTVGTRWGFFQSSANNNAFAGNTRFGGTTAPVATVDVTGSVAASTTIRTGGYTVATLPAGTTGDRAYVTDATAPTYLGALTGGGAVVCPVFKNATVWVSA